METLTHAGLQLLITDQKFYLVPTSGSGNEVLEIDRLSCELALIDRGAIAGVQATASERKVVCILLGIIRLLAGPYLVVGTSHRQVGSIEGHRVHELTGHELIPFVNSTLHLSQSQERDNRLLFAMVERVLSTPGFYYSYSYDLTHSQQRKRGLLRTNPDFFKLPLHERADERFVWNVHLSRELAVQPELRRFIVPVMHGFFEDKSCSVNSHRFQFVLISRRSWHRAGVRYFMRGINDEGHSANFVETEQMIFYNNSVGSFVQTRGSIPLYWSQRPTLKYKPSPKLQSGVDHEAGLQLHFDEQIVNYGQQTVLNLIDQKGSEKNLGDAFKFFLSKLANMLISYDAFDFHKECSRMRWHRLSILLDRLLPTQNQYAYYMQGADGILLMWQRGVFRTNCIDCLDRTNVVQSMLARRSLAAQLQVMQVLSVGERLEDKREFEKMFKNVWADNADYCATQYTGTGALKTDFTRTGKRTHLGLLKDGYNSAIRYYYNNFADGFRQDAIDLFLGNYVVEQWVGLAGSSILPRQSWLVRMLPLLFLVGISMLFMSIIIPSTDLLWQLVYILFWGMVVMGTLFYIYSNSRQFIDTPKLVQTDHKKSQ